MYMYVGGQEFDNDINIYIFLVFNKYFVYSVSVSHVTCAISTILFVFEIEF